MISIVTKKQTSEWKRLIRQSVSEYNTRFESNTDLANWMSNTDLISYDDALKVIIVGIGKKWMEKFALVKKTWGNK